MMVLLMAPCAPITNDCSISAVFDGPDIKTPYPVSSILAFDMPGALLAQGFYDL